jgi:hypothetical protein
LDDRISTITEYILAWVMVKFKSSDSRRINELVLLMSQID